MQIDLTIPPCEYRWHSYPTRTTPSRWAGMALSSIGTLTDGSSCSAWKPTRPRSAPLLSIQLVDDSKAFGAHMFAALPPSYGAHPDM